MLIRYGYEMSLRFQRDTHLLCLLDIHPDRVADIVEENPLTPAPYSEVSTYYDGFGNRCRRLLAPAGDMTIAGEAVISDNGLPDPVVTGAHEIAVHDLPNASLMYLLGSRYCETDKLSQTAWNLFGSAEPGWPRVQTICDFVHDHIEFGYHNARATRTAMEAFDERTGVCRDYAHLAIAFCRCMNIPARYVNGYLGDIRVPFDPAPMDYSAWFEAYLGGVWHTFDARHNIPRIGRVPVARGRDATDVPLIHSFGPHVLTKFQVFGEELPPAESETAAKTATPDSQMGQQISRQASAQAA